MAGHPTRAPTRSHTMPRHQGRGAGGAAAKKVGAEASSRTITSGVTRSTSSHAERADAASSTAPSGTSSAPSSSTTSPSSSEPGVASAPGSVFATRMPGATPSRVRTRVPAARSRARSAADQARTRSSAPLPLTPRRTGGAAPGGRRGGEEADRKVELPAELLRDVARIAAHRDHLDAPVDDVPVVLAELAELRHAERSPVPPVAEDEQAAAASGREAEGRAIGGRQREVGEAFADPRPVLARAVHREGEEKPAREGEDAERERSADGRAGARRGDEPIHTERSSRRHHGEELPRDAAIAREAERGEEVEPEAAGRDEGREDRRHAGPLARARGLSRGRRRARRPPRPGAPWARSGRRRRPCAACPPAGGGSPPRPRARRSRGSARRG